MINAPKSRENPLLKGSNFLRLALHEAQSSKMIGLFHLIWSETTFERTVSNEKTKARSAGVSWAVDAMGQSQWGYAGKPSSFRLAFFFVEKPAIAE